MPEHIEYRLVRSKRRSIALHITDDAVLCVRAPHKVSREIIDDFINKKIKWVKKHLNMARAHMEAACAARQEAQPIDHYKKQAKQFIPARVGELSSLTGLSYKGIKITSARKRFGSCSLTNKLTFSWRLLLAPEEVLDYVIIHELAHTAEKNHSKRFWSKVRELMPDYRSAHTWLKQNGASLNI
jgi:hypothetical protein